MAQHRSITQLLRKNYSKEKKLTLCLSWADTWQQNQTEILQRLGKAVKNNNFDETCICIGQLKEVTEKYFTALPNVINTISFTYNDKRIIPIVNDKMNHENKAKQMGTDKLNWHNLSIEQASKIFVAAFSDAIVLPNMEVFKHLVDATRLNNETSRGLSFVENNMEEETTTYAFKDEDGRLMHVTINAETNESQFILV